MCVHDVVAAPVRALEALGAQSAADVRGVAAASRRRLHDAAGLGDRERSDWRARRRDRARADAGTTIVDMSTIDPLVTDRLAAEAAASGFTFADAPVGRLASHAERGESLFMVGASDDVFARIKPMLEAMGTTIHHCGGVGTGHAHEAREQLPRDHLVPAQRRGDRAVAALRPHAREDARRHPRHDGDERPAQDRVAVEGAQGRRRRPASRSISPTRI